MAGELQQKQAASPREEARQSALLPKSMQLEWN